MTVWAGARRPNLFVVGEPKCGTTTLHDVLGRHPDVFMTPYKEPRFFCGDLHRLSDAHHGAARMYPVRTEARYAACFRGAAAERVVGESSTSYLVSREAAAGIAGFAPEARIVALFRDPVDLLHSLYHQLRENTDEDAPTFADALAREPERRAGRGLPPGLGCPSHLHYSEWARFDEHLERYLARFPRDRVHVLAYDDLLADPSGAVNALFAFLEVDPAVEVSIPRLNPTGAPRFPRLRRALRSGPVWRWAVPRLPVRAYGLAERLQRRLLTRPAAKAPLDPALRAALRERFAPHVLRLSELAGRDLAREWGYR